MVYFDQSSQSNNTLRQLRCYEPQTLGERVLLSKENRKLSKGEPYYIFRAPENRGPSPQAPSETIVIVGDVVETDAKSRFMGSWDPSTNVLWKFRT